MKWWRNLRPRERRTVIIGAIAVLPGLLYFWAVVPYRTALADAREQLATERATLVRERAAVAASQQNPRLRQVADSAMRAMRPRLFEGKDDVMASAELASYLGEVARRARVFLQDAATRPAPAAVDGVRTLRVELRAESDLLGTLLFLQALERGDRLVRVDRFDVTHSSRGADKDMETLSISATISGFAVTDSSSTTSGTKSKASSVSASGATATVSALGGTPR